MPTEEFPKRAGRFFACSMDENNVNISNMNLPSIYVVRYDHKLKGKGGGIYTGLLIGTILVNASYSGQAYDVAEKHLKTVFSDKKYWLDITIVCLAEFKDQVHMVP